MSDVIATGKTKRVVTGPRPGTVLLQAIDRLTGGDAARVSEIKAIGRAKTRQAANVFRLLERAGIPTAFIDQPADDALLCRACEMVPLEFVVRRFPYGSYLKRVPSLAQETPKAFDEPVWEIFHKQAVAIPPHVEAPTQMDEGEARTRFLRDGAWPDGVYTDPYIAPGDTAWAVHSAKAPVADNALMTITPVLTADDLDTAIHAIVLPTFGVLEHAWSTVDTEHGPVRLADMKVEIGRDAETNKLVLADVVDNDSWRVWPGGDPARRLDKQAFRDGAPEAEVTANYELVTRLTETFSTLEPVAFRGRTEATGRPE